MYGILFRTGRHADQARRCTERKQCKLSMSNAFLFSVCGPRESKSVAFPLLGMTRNLQFRLRDWGCLRSSKKSWCSSTSKLGSGNGSDSPESGFGSAMKPRTWGLHCACDTLLHIGRSAAIPGKAGPQLGRKLPTSYGFDVKCWMKT